MNLTEYVALCARLEAYCTRVRESGRFEGADTLEHDLRRFYYAEKDWGDLSRDCQTLNRAQGRKRIIEGYRRQLAVYGSLSALIADLEAGVVTCPESLKGLRIHALNLLYDYCSELSKKCLAVFGGIQTVPERINSTPYALEVAKKWQKAGYLNPGFLYIMHDYEDDKERRGLIGQELGHACGHGWITRIEEYWGMGSNQISHDADKAKDSTKQDLARYGLKIK